MSADRLNAGLITASQALDMLQVQMEEDGRRPLVTLDETAPNGSAAFTFYDREMRGSSYEFWCNDQRDALQWLQHMAQKTWVTKRHLELFSILALEAFKPAREVEA